MPVVIEYEPYDKRDLVARVAKLYKLELTSSPP
jgi:hypothetical protein